MGAQNLLLAARKRGWIDFDAGMVPSRGLDAAEAALIGLGVPFAVIGAAQ